MYCNFLNGATHAMRTSHLTEDLEATLRLVCFDRPSLVRDRPRVNETRPRWKDRAVMSEATEQRLREVDNLDGLDFPFVVESCANLSGGQPGRM